MSDYNCPYCGLEHNYGRGHNIGYYIKCECGKTFFCWLTYEVEYHINEILFPEREDAEDVNKEVGLLGLEISNFTGSYNDYRAEKDRLMAMLTPLPDEKIPQKGRYAVVVWYDGRFKARDRYRHDDYEGVRYVYDRRDFNKVVAEWRKTSQFRKEG